MLSGAVAAALLITVAQAPPAEATQDSPSATEAGQPSEAPADELATPQPSPTASAQPEETPASAPAPEEAQVGESFTAFSRDYPTADGSRVLEVFAEPTFFRDGNGRWDRIDTSLVVSEDGRQLRPRKADRRAARIERRLERSTASVETPFGPLTLRHVGARTVEGAVEDGDTVRYRGAMGGRDLLVEVTTTGFKDSVVLADAAAEESWRAEFSLPKGLTARQAPRGIEFVDKWGAVLGTYGDGLALDSAGGGQTPPATAEVSVRLVGQSKSAAVVEVSVDRAWLEDPARVFPVTIDPVHRTTTLQSYGPGNTCGAVGQTGSDEYCDTDVSQPEPNTSQYQSPWLDLGSNGVNRAHYMFLKFPTGSTLQGSGYRVVDAKVRIYAYAGQAKTYHVYRNSFSARADTTWNANRPGTIGSWYHQWNLPAQAGWLELPVTNIAQVWFNGSTNHGIQVQAADLGDHGTFRQFTSMENSGGAYKPSLKITYENKLPTTTRTGPASGTFVCSPPVLSARYDDSAEDGRVDFNIWGPGGHVQYAERAARRGQTVSFQSPPVPGGHYSWHTRGWDGSDVSNPEWGEFWAYFMNTPPNRPAWGDEPTNGTRYLIGQGHPTLSAFSSDTDNNLRDLVFDSYGPNGWREQTNPGIAAGNNEQRSWRPSGTAGGSYSWYVGAYDHCNARSELLSGSYRINRRPAVPAQQSPGDGLVAAVGSPPQLSATYSDPDGERGNVDFRVERLNSAGVWEDIRWQPVGPTVSGQVARYTPPVVEAGRPDLGVGRYRWSVRAWDGPDHGNQGDHSAADGSHGPTREFRITTPPDVPTRVAPADGARTSGAPTLTARYSDPDGDPGNVDFFLRDAAGNKPACIGADPVVMDNGGQRYPSGTSVSYRPSCLTAGTYTWYTRAWDGLLSANSASSSFRVNAPPAPPSNPAPGTADPANPEIVCNRRMPLSATYTDADGDDGRIYFRLYQYDPATGAHTATAHIGYGLPNPAPDGTVVTFTPAADLANGRYSWRAYANDLLNSSAYTGYRYFDVECAAPGQPQQVQATKGDKEATVTWQPPPPNLLPVTGYQVSAYTADGTAVGDPVELPATARSHRRTGLANGTGYYFEVSAQNTIGQGQPSRSTTVTPSGKPFAPTGVTSTAGDTRATVTWTAANPNGSPLTGNRVEVTRHSDNTRLTALDETVAGNATTATIDGLANGTAYRFRVIATNANGDGPASADASPGPVTPSGKPSAPTGVDATAGDLRATVTWAAAGNNGSTLTGNRVEVTRHSDNVRMTALDETVAGTATSATVTGLANGTAYRFRVIATNANGASQPSADAGPVTPSGRPFAPTGVTSTAGDLRATVTWTAANPNGSPLTGNRVEVTRHSDNTRLPTLDETVAGNATTATIDGLANGTAYRFRVIATNANGDGPASADASPGPVTPSGKPSAPTGVTATPGDLRATVTWTAAGNNGSTLTGNRVEVTRHSDNTRMTGLDETVAGTATSATITGLANGTAYRFRVVAANKNGDGAASADASPGPVTPSGKPSAPTGVNATAGDLRATVTWTAAGNNGATLTENRVEVTRHSDNTRMTGLDKTVAGTATSATITGLANGTAYRFRVIATNANGDGPASADASPGPVTPSGRPFAPTGVRAVRGNTTATVDWTAADNNGAPVDGYRVQTYLASDGALQQQAATTGGSGRQATVTGLANNTEYYFKVVAHNLNGDGPASAASSPVRPHAPPAVPVLLSPDEGAAVVVATLEAGYSDPEKNVGRVEFEVYEGVTGPGAAPPVATGSDEQVPSDDPANPASYTPVPPLVPGDYSWRARASDGDWESAWSASRSFAVAGTPDAPQQVVAEEGDKRATVRWQGSGGLLIDGYRVETYKAIDDSLQPQRASTDATGRQVVIENLVNGTAYYFKVYAHNPVGDSLPGQSDPVTPAGPPFAPPDVAAVGGNKSARVTWGAADGNGRDVDGYRVETYLRNGQRQPQQVDTDGAARDATVPGLTNGQEYYFVVTAHTPPSRGNRNGYGDPSAPSNVVRPNAPPDIPTLSAPAPGQIVARNPRPQLRASYLDSDGDAGELRFELRLGSTLVEEHAVAAAGGAEPQELSWQPASFLTQGAVYTWTVTAHDGYDPSPGSASRTFQANILPDDAQLLSPGEGATVAQTTPPTLSARYSDADGHVGMVRFVLRTGNGDLVETEDVDAVVSSQAVRWEPMTTLTAGTTYQWTARAHDGLESSTTSEPRTFRVNHPPGAPAPSEPADGAQTKGTPTLSASYVDPDGDAGTVAFHVRDANGAQVAGSPFSSGQAAAGTTASVTLSPALPNGTYHWQAHAHDGRDLSGLGASRSFTVVNNRGPELPSVPHPGAGVTLPRGPEFLGVTYSDPDGDQGWVEFKLYPVAAGPEAPALRTWIVSGVNSGARADTSNAPVLYDGEYRWTAQATDSDRVTSAVAEWRFTVRSDSSSFGFTGWAAWTKSVNTGLGSYTTTATDMTVATAGPELTVVRSYNSADRDDKQAAFGRGWSFNYDMTVEVDSYGNVAVTHPDGRREIHAYQRGSYKPPTGYYSTLTKRDGVYHLTTKDRTVYAFNNEERLASIRDANGRTLTLNYVSGRLATVTTVLNDGAPGRTLSFTWDGGRVRTVKTDHVAAHQRQLEWTYHYEDRGLLTKVCQPWSVEGQQSCTTYGYSPEKLLNRITRPRSNNEALIDYHAAGLRVAAVTDGAGKKTTFEYPDGHTKITDPRGNVTLHEYDSQYRLMAETNGRGFTIRYKYDPVSGARYEIKDQVGGLAVIRYDKRGNPERVTNPAVEATYNTYLPPDGPKGDLLTEVRDPRTAPNPSDANLPPTDATFLTSYDYDDRRNRTRQLSPPVRVHGSDEEVRLETRWAYSQGTEPVPEELGGGTVPPGLLLEETNPRGDRTTYSYDRFGDLRSKVDRSGLTTRYSYDELGRKLTETVIDTVANLQPTTTYTYDEVGHPVTVLEPAVRNQVTTLTHQLKTTNVYDLNGNLLSETRSDAIEAAGQDPERVTRYTYDEADRQKTVVDPLNGTLTRVFDAAGNVETVTDQQGRVTRTHYDQANLPIFVVAEGFHDDPLNPANPRNINLTETTYDQIGRRETERDAEGRTRRWAYDGADRVKSVTLEGFDNLDGSQRPVELEAYVYDQAGNLIEERRGSSLQTTRHEYDAANRETRMVLDPADDDPALELDRVTEYGYDQAGNQVSRTLSQGPELEREQLLTERDAAGWAIAETVVNDYQELLRSEMGYDQRGNLVAATDPRGTGSDAQTRARYTTNQQHDEYDRLTATLLPPVLVESGGGAPAREERPTSQAGFDTFGNATDVVDSRGNRTTNGYDALDRLERTDHPSYQRPDGGGPLLASETFAYDAVGNLRAQTSRRGQTTEFVYDNLNRVFEQRDPAVGGAAPGTIRYGYDDLGNRDYERDQEGAVSRWEYDDLNRVRRQTAEVRPAGGADGLTAVTTFDYDDLGRLTWQQDPASYASGPATGETFHQYNAAGERTRTTHPLTTAQAERGDPAAVTGFVYDRAGRVLVETMPLGRSTEHHYDLAGREQVTVTKEGNTPLTTTSFGYDAAGNQTARTSPRGHAEGPLDQFTTTYDYDAANRLVEVEVPADADTTLRTGYGYDAAGNLTRVTDGNRRVTVYDYQEWGLLEQVVEPSTAQHPDPADRTWTTSYDLGGLPDVDLLPGGVTVRRDFDALGRVTSESGCRRDGGGGCLAAPANPDAPQATRELRWDRVGRRVQADHPRGAVSLTYDDRDLLVSASGGAGAASFRYDADGRMTSRSDSSGSAAFTWTQAGELASASDPLTGQRRDYRWDDAGQLQEMRLPGGAERDYSYDGLGRIEREVLRGPAGQDSDFVYGYDADGNLTRQQVTFDGEVGAAANPGEGVHRYCYDHAGRLTRWDRRQPQVPGAAPDCAPVDQSAPGADQVTDYRWDNAGNRLAAGSATFAYDERNRLVSSPEGAHTWTARGTLADVAKNGVHTPSTFDALGRQTGAGDLTLDYDGLDRLAARHSADAPANSTRFAYAGTEIDPVASTGELPALYARSPGGRLLAQTENGGPALLAGLGRHGDLTQLYTPDGTLQGSAVYDPFGQPTVAGTGSRLGFQADWTDPANGQVWMGARWYDPANAQFTSRDTVRGELTTPVRLNRYTYALNNPLAYFDPDGREPCATPPNCDYGYTGNPAHEQNNFHVTHTGYRDPFTGADADYVRNRPRGYRPPAPQNKVVKQFQNFTTGALKGAGGVVWGLVELPKSLWDTAQAELDAALQIQHEQGVAAAILHIGQRSQELSVELVLATLTGLAENAKTALYLTNPAVLVIEGRRAEREGRFDEWLHDLGRDTGELGAETLITVLTAGAGKAASATARALAGERLAMRTLGRGRALNPPTPVAPGSVADDLIGAACSFSAATAVVMADGMRKAISEVVVGDYVLAEDPESGVRGLRRVTHVWAHEDTVIDLEIDGDLVTTTEDHPFWNATDGGWQQANELDAGDLVRTAAGDLVKVAGLRPRTSRTTTAFNLTVDGIHTYFVGVGEDDVLVHNTCGPSLRSRMQAAGPGDEFGLPNQGRIRYVPPRGYNPANSLPRGPQGGYIDRFGNEWVVGPSRTPNQPFEWDVQLSRTGREQLGWLSRDGAHVNVSPHGEVTHL